MKDEKPLIKSITGLAGLIMVGLGAAGIVTSEADIIDLAAHADAITESVLGMIVIFGRVRANSKIRALW